MVKSVGVGPWGAGLSFGDSTLGFLAAWIGHAAAAGWPESKSLRMSAKDMGIFVDFSFFHQLEPHSQFFNVLGNN